MRINSELGYEPVTYSELTDDEEFWSGCKSCVNFEILTSKERKNCMCTAMLFDPKDHYEPKETVRYFEENKKGFERLQRIKQWKLLRPFLKKEKDKNFNGYFPNSAIDTLKINYTKIKDYLKYTLYYRYYTGESYELYDKKDDYLCNNITRLLNNADSYYDNSYYYKIERKNLFVCHNKECGFIILELETDFYMILSEWNINGIDILEKMNFKEFIENSK